MSASGAEKGRAGTQELEGRGRAHGTQSGRAQGTRRGGEPWLLLPDPWPHSPPGPAWQERVRGGLLIPGVLHREGCSSGWGRGYGEPWRKPRRNWDVADKTGSFYFSSLGSVFYFNYFLSDRSLLASKQSGWSLVFELNSYKVHFYVFLWFLNAKKKKRKVC